MKLTITLITRLVIASCLLQTVVAEAGIESGDGGAIPPALLSNDIPSAIVSSSEIEKLWPQHPQTYFQSTTRAAHILGGAPNEPGARQALLNLFSNMIQKPYPTNSGLAGSCVEEKCNVILYYLNFDQVRKDISKWVAIARFIGEVRAQMVPNFTRKPVYSLNGLGQSTQERKQVLDQNEQNQAINALQQTLRATDSKLTFHLLHHVNRISGGSETKELIEQIVSSAHLNQEEQRKLNYK
jgi:hypothetical protein